MYLYNLIVAICLCCIISACRYQPEGEQFMPIVVNSDANAANKILIVSHHTMNGDYLEYTLHNHHSYAKKNGYDYWFRNGKIDAAKYVDSQGKDEVFKLGLFWQKIEAVQQALELKNSAGHARYDWVMWVDADAFFTNFSIQIENIISELGDDNFLAISRDFPKSDCVNAGVWIIKNNYSARQFLNSVSALYPFFKNNSWPEQQAMQDLIYGYVTQDDIDRDIFPKWQKRSCEESKIIKGVKVFPQRRMNAFYSYFSKRYDMSAWKPGDFIAHFAGEPDRLNLIKRLMACIKVQSPTNEGCEINGWWRADG